MKVEGGTACLPLTDGAHGAIPLSPREWREKIEGGSEEGGGRKVLLLDVRNGERGGEGKLRERGGSSASASVHAGLGRLRMGRRTFCNSCAT